jgi:hypothetical protein
VRLTTTPRKKYCYETSRGGQGPPRAVELTMMMMMMTMMKMMMMMMKSAWWIHILNNINWEFVQDFSTHKIYLHYFTFIFPSFKLIIRKRNHFDFFKDIRGL